MHSKFARSQGRFLGKRVSSGFECYLYVSVNDLLCSITHVLALIPPCSTTCLKPADKIKFEQALICHGTIMQNFVESLDADTPTVTVQFTGTKHTGYLVSAEQVQGYVVQDPMRSRKSHFLGNGCRRKYPPALCGAKQTCRNKSYLPVLESRQSIINYWGLVLLLFLPYIATLQKKYVVKTNCDRVARRLQWFLYQPI